ncbi:MAG TPA: 16S rRNA (guanine(527)-N(7))-methyltransferase RsmG [Fimbriimonadaceae bacterium]|nr:16S rRNA (guanine(527)-N(7))-methyltransferase RsmG [Fimbriimonadaceae bacterium]
MDRDAFAAACQVIGITLDDSKLAMFEAFESALYESNKVKNLTRVPQDECWITHFLDSLLFHDLIEGQDLLDLGTGPGLPAWPLAAAFPNLQVTGLDSNGKMLAFLETQALPNLRVVNSRIEDTGWSERYDTVTGRALAPYAIQLEVSVRPCRKGGLLLPMRTAKDEETIRNFPYDQLGLELERIEERDLPVLGAKRLYPIIRKVKKTPKEFPRPWATMKKQPLNG